ncbi:C-type mannose receptor 2-like [Gigantopelta aegis]|uniref:C-type mannose receptor 2-like n=1 Tax=Gigantopelta aegis TaxID=1735272 RepID=UPI001B88E645|nr:C-type mannose receptor 2-like [Gigantopelta aegis]
MATSQKVLVDVMLVFLMTALIHVTDSVRTCTNLDNFPFLRRNTQLNNTGIDVLEGLGFVECAAQCKLRKKCRSFSFQHSSGYCKLYENTIGQAGNYVVLKTGTDTTNIDDWPSRIAGPCADHSCSINDVCEPTSRNSKKCVTTYCSSPPLVTNATAKFTTSHETTKVGSRLSYTCDVNFHPVGNRTCLPDGTWSNFTCEPDPVCPALCDTTRNKCYTVYYEETKSWTDALATCSNNGSLVDIKTEQDFIFINKTVRGRKFWTGLSDLDNDGVWTWTDGTNITYDNWSVDSPVTGKRCVTLDATGRYETINCDEKLTYICRVYPDCPAPPPVANAVPAYTVQPNITVGVVLPYTCNISYKPDGEMRCLAGGYWSNFTCSGECPVEDGYVLLDNPKLCFKAFADFKFMEDARKICQASGAMLIVLDTNEKNTAVSDYIVKTLGSSSYLIGLTDKQTEGMYIWENGNLVTFSKWAPEEPRNKAYVDCVVLTSKYWYNVNCFDRIRFVCEKQI